MTKSTLSWWQTPDYKLRKQAYDKQYRQAGHIIEKRRTTSRNRSRLLISNMPPGVYETTYLDQNGACAICHVCHPLLYADHCHATGQPRGLLCRNCNLGLGFFKDSRTSLERAIQYLAQPSTGIKWVKSVNSRNRLRSYHQAWAQAWRELETTLLCQQGGRCPILLATTPGRKGSWIIDHDDKTGFVRGVLCHQANVGLGMFVHNPSLLDAAITYLQHSVSQAA